MDSLHTYEPTCKDPLGDFEGRLIEKHRRQMREELKLEIEQRDRHIFEQSKRICIECGLKTYVHGHTHKYSILSSFGEVSVRLHRLYCPNCKHITVPGAHVIPRLNVSALLAEKICDLASKMPYAKAAESLFVQHGIRLSTKKFWTYVQSEAGLIEDVLKTQAEVLYKTGEAPLQVDLKGENPLIIGIDGGHVRGWRTNPSFEVKCATVATGSVSGPGKKRHLKNRAGYAAECSVDEFRKRVSVLAIKSGYLSASSRIFVSDGAAWIGKMIADWFPDAVHVLDMYHLKNKVSMLFGLSSEGEDAHLKAKALKACDSYNPEQILSVISSWTPPSAAKADSLQDLRAYIKNNALAIRNHKLVNVHGSGWIEKGVDLMISRRLKNRGMAWTIKGSSNMIPFAVLRYNKQWSVYWNRRKGLDLSVGA